MTQQNQLSTFLALPELFTPSNYEPGAWVFEKLTLRIRHINSESPTLGRKRSRML
jgi:hypothetical protein